VSIGLILLIIVLLFVFGGGGYYGYSRYPDCGPGLGIGGLLLLILVVWLILRSGIFR